MSLLRGYDARLQTLALTVLLALASPALAGNLNLFKRYNATPGWAQSWVYRDGHWEQGYPTKEIWSDGPDGNPSPGYGVVFNDGAWGTPDDPYDRGSRFDTFYMNTSSRQTMITAHAVLAVLAFVVFFPFGSILIRLASFPRLWLVHAAIQMLAYVLYFVAFVIGVWIVSNTPVDLLSHHHPLIGIVIFSLLFFQPILGWIHHKRFKEIKRRTIWSHAHLWLGRGLITLGMINGALGLMFAAETGVFGPTTKQFIAYCAVTGSVWLLWFVISVIGERRRRKKSRGL